MKEKIKTLIKFLFFLSLGGLLFWLAYRDQNIEQIKRAFQEVDYFWIFLSLLLGLFSHFSRTIRWNMLIHTLDYRPKIANTFFAVMIGYFANLALPRMGEVSRCGVLRKYEKIPFTKLLGTVILERISDLVMLLILLVVVLITQFSVVLNFLESKPEVKTKLSQIISSPITIIAVIAIIAAGIAVVILLKEKIKRTVIYQKISKTIKNLWAGIKSIRHLKNKWAFVGHTLFIWIMYYLMFYVCFWAFESTDALKAFPMAGLTVFIFASFGMVAPVQGGIGAWHFMVIGALMVYGIPEGDGKAFALVVHGATTLMLIVLGFISVAVLPIINNKQKVEKKQAE